LIAFALGGVSALVIAWLPHPVAVDVASVTRGDMSVTVDEEGQTRVKDRYVISAPVAATVERITLAAGDRVEVGQLVALFSPLEPPMLDARSREQALARVGAADAARRRAGVEVERANTELAFARGELARELALQRAGAATQHAIEQAELRLATAQSTLASLEFAASVASHEHHMAQLAMQNATLSNQGRAATPLRAHVSGQVLRVLQPSAGVVQLGAPLIELGDLSRLEIVADVLTSDAVKITPGARATVERWGGAQPLQAHVRSVEPSAFTRVSALGVQEQRVHVVLDLDSPPRSWSSLGDGYRVEVQIVVWHAQKVLRVPSSALFRDADRWSVFQVDAEGRARLSAVTIGQRNAERAEILSGLSAGSRVIVHPSDRVRDAARVTAR
jgi:HlyD family secretion protein